MSSRTAALYSKLRYDLSYHLDPYQLDAMSAGKPMWPDISIKQAQCYALGQSLLKKFNESENPSSAASQAALDKFLAVNRASGEWSLECQDRVDEELIGGLKSVMYEFWYRDGYSLFSSLEEIISSGGLGPGANVAARGADFYTKLWDSPLSATRDDIHYSWMKTVSRDTRWTDALNCCVQRYKPRIVAGNKLCFVNKNVTVARCISKEPTINMWCQLGVGRLLTARLNEFFGINLSNQQGVNRTMAQTGSEWDLYSTIDLESASDSLSLGLMAEILPKPLLDVLMMFRSPTVTLPDGRVIRLEMMSTMGNGFTFPLQTAIFSAVVATAYRYLGLNLRKHGPPDSRNFAVFGDDIVVRREATRLVVRLLRLIGCTVNQSKSYVEGPFRESCGADFFAGQPCRGVYVKKLKTVQDYYVAINGLNRWSSITGIHLTATVRYLVHAAGNLDKRLNWVPPDENDDAGIHVPLDKAHGIHRLHHGIVSYKYSAAVARGLIVRDFDVVGGKGEVERGYNPSGLWLSFLFGSVKGYRISLRQRSVRYITKRRVTSSWGNPIKATLPPSRHDVHAWLRWSDAVRYNLS